jgi:hypothetical protein
MVLGVARSEQFLELDQHGLAIHELGDQDGREELDRAR